MFTSSSVEIKLEGCTLHAINNFRTEDKDIYYAWYVNEITETDERTIVKQLYKSDNSFTYTVNNKKNKYKLIAFIENRKTNMRIAKTIMEFKLLDDGAIKVLRKHIRDFSYENVHRVKLDYKEIDSYNFCIDEPVIYSIFWEGIHFDFLINYIEGCENSIIFGTGAITKEILPYPFFSRAMWLNDIQCTGIWYFDPSLYMYEDLRLVWGYGEEKRWVLENIAFLLHKLVAKLNLDIKNSVFMGSSGGGTMSILLATMLRGKAVAINPQLLIENHIQSLVEPFKKAIAKDEQLIESRCNVVTHFQREGYIPNIDIYVNKFSEIDMEKQINPFLDALDKAELSQESIKLHFYTELEGHNGMPSKNDTIRIAHNAFSTNCDGISFVRQFKILPFLERAKKNYMPWIDSTLEKNMINELRQNIAESEGHNTLSCSISLSNNILEGQIKGTDLDDTDMVVFYLIKNSKVIEKTQWSKESTIEYSLKESGVYRLEGFVRKANGRICTTKSLTCSYYNVSDREEYYNFSNTLIAGNELNAKLEYRNSTYPNQDFCLISANQDLSQYSFDKFASNVGLNYFENVLNIDEWNTSVITQNVLQYQNCKYIFSGVTMINNSYIEGIEDLNEDILDKIHGNMGMFSYVEIDNKSIRISNDFFNFAPIFYYKTESMCIVSNRYHLILLCIKFLGIHGTIDVDKAILNLSNDSLVMNQNLSHRMDIMEISQLQNCYDIIFSSKWEFITNEYFSSLEKPYSVDESQQEELLSQGAKDIVDQIRTLIDNPHFKNIIVDLSGGVDSRIVYAALTNIENCRDKAYIYTKDVGGDLPIALRINNLYQYNWDNVKTEIEVVPLKEASIMDRSFFMGQYYSHALLSSGMCSDSVRCSGAVGEASYRTVFSRALHSESSRVEDYISDIFLWLISSTIVSSENIYERFCKLFSNQLNDMPGLCLNEKLDRYYLEFRHAYHHSIMHPLVSREKRWYPMQSKAIFLLQHLRYNTLSNLELQIEVMNKLNPLLVWIPFENEKDNKDFQMIKDNLDLDVRFREIAMPLDEDKEAYNCAQIDKKKNTNYLSKQLYQQYDDLGEKIYCACLSNLRKLFMYMPDLEQDIGIDLFFYIKNNKDNTLKIKYIDNKIVSLIDQIEIFQ